MTLKQIIFMDEQNFKIEDQPQLTKKERRRLKKESREESEQRMGKTRKLKKISWWIFIILLLGGLAGWLGHSQSQPGELDDFAKCLNEKGAKFYGAFWCSHCQNQKAVFGKSAKYLNYIECSTADGRSQISACTDAGIESYPTWIFADGSKESGELSLSRLAEKTGCVLPEFVN